MNNLNPQLAEYLKRPLPDLLDELDLYDDTTKGGSQVWQKIAAPLHKRICDEWNWCVVRQDSRFENDYDLAVAVLTILSTRALHLNADIDLVLVSAILIKRGLDNFCGCL